MSRRIVSSYLGLNSASLNLRNWLFNWKGHGENDEEFHKCTTHASNIEGWKTKRNPQFSMKFSLKRHQRRKAKHDNSIFTLCIMSRESFSTFSSFRLTSPLLISLRKSNFHLNFTQLFRVNDAIISNWELPSLAQWDCLHFFTAGILSTHPQSGEALCSFEILMLDGGKFYYKICSRWHFTLSLAAATILFISGKGPRLIIINIINWTFLFSHKWDKLRNSFCSALVSCRAPGILLCIIPCWKLITKSFRALKLT